MSKSASRERVSTKSPTAATSDYTTISSKRRETRAKTVGGIHVWTHGAVDMSYRGHIGPWTGLCDELSP